MIQRLEIRNFENHEHLVLDDFSPGFNLICGDSDIGKTSVIRAIRLIAYNEFNPDSVRIGHTNCEVTAVTERGTVKVLRGKNNTWEVTPRGGTTEVYDKIGKNILPQAAEILGMNEVTLGDMQIAVNVMDQHESHFMLYGLDDKKLSGSVKAQIIDEISGLTGIETIIRSVGLDNSRIVRRINEKEEEAQRLQDRLHDKNEIEAEEIILKQSEEIMESYDDDIFAIGEIRRILDEREKMKREISRVKSGIEDIPNCDAAKKYLDQSDKAEGTASVMRTMLQNSKNTGRRITEIKESIVEIPDTETAAGIVETAESLFVKAGEIEVMISEAVGIREKISEIEKQIGNFKQKLYNLYDERDELLSSFTVCPLSLQPISGECRKSVRSPVRES